MPSQRDASGLGGQRAAKRKGKKKEEVEDGQSAKTKPAQSQVDGADVCVGRHIQMREREGLSCHRFIMQRVLSSLLRLMELYLPTATDRRHNEDGQGDKVWWSWCGGCPGAADAAQTWTRLADKQKKE